MPIALVMLVQNALIYLGKISRGGFVHAPILVAPYIRPKACLPCPFLPRLPFLYSGLPTRGKDAQNGVFVARLSFFVSCCKGWFGIQCNVCGVME